MGTSLFKKIFSAIKSDKLEDVEANIDELLKNDPGNPNHHVKKGDICQRLGKNKKAIGAYHKAAYIFREQGFLKKSLAIYKIILRLDPGNVMAMDNAEQAIREVESIEEEFVQPVYVEETQEAPGMARNPFFRPFNSDEIEQILNRAELRNYSDTAVIIREDASGDSIFAVKDGTATVVTSLLGRDIELATLRTGDIFGEVAFLTGRARTASVIAKGDLTVHELKRPLLEEMLERKPEIMEYLNEIYNLRSKGREDKIKNV
ncbi:MAG TPA: cyclic nucleotide-binding domain-containing protein [Nitrospirae bacterium]|nr:DNA-binding transcriptional dual regulator Crp [bacterium BMS3Abin10]GBE37911.1 DNA-binding transcriptional dual regulator Crp [bacterium BMS3Bbin08]HDH50934.1 cyclic nucleotide-binding domain-containing protein [Nitrospirota bacterium]HDK41647.1 cyclic nucleotide-binding domain-containing protein [Nitrospirota bacterium]HDK81884.1 cyclic nucleotide-binding domain-containing protein [Nitrospirota bacterium]